MAQTHYKTLLRKVLLGFITEQDPVLAMLEWVAQMMMQIEAESKVGAEKGKHTKDRKTYFSGARVGKTDTRLRTLIEHVQLCFPIERSQAYSFAIILYLGENKKVTGLSFFIAIERHIHAGIPT